MHLPTCSLVVRYAMYAFYACHAFHKQKATEKLEKYFVNLLMNILNLQNHQRQGRLSHESGRKRVVQPKHLPKSQLARDKVNGRKM